MIDNDILDFAEHNEHGDVIDVNDLNNDMMVEEASETSLNIINDYDNFKADGEIYSIAMTEKGNLIFGDGEDYTYFYVASINKMI